MNEDGNTTWYLRDRQGVAHGPFSNEELRDRVKMGYLSMHAPVALAMDGPFAKIASFYQDAASAFKGEPLSPDPKEFVDENRFDNGQWFWKDANGNLHGPCHQAQMREWTLVGQIDKDTEVREGEGEDGDFFTVQELFPDLHKAFLPNVENPRKLNHSPIAHSFHEIATNSNPGRDVPHARHGRSFRSKLGSGKQQIVKSKLFARVANKHRRSNSAGCSYDAQRIADDVPDVFAFRKTGAAIPTAPNPQPIVTSGHGSGKSGSKFNSKKLLSVVTTPKYNLSKYSKASIKSEPASNNEQGGDSAATHAHHSGSQNLRRLKSSLTKYRYKRRKRKSKDANASFQMKSSEQEHNISFSNDYNEGGSFVGDYVDSDDEDDDEDEDDEDEDDEEDFIVDEMDQDGTEAMAVDQTATSPYDAVEGRTSHLGENSTDFVSDESSSESEQDVEVVGNSFLESDFTNGNKLRDQSSSRERRPPIQRASQIHILTSDRITDEVHSRLNSYWNPIHTKSNAAKDNELLQIHVAELQDENSQLRAYIRQLKAMVGESAPDLKKKLPPAPSVVKRSGSVVSGSAPTVVTQGPKSKDASPNLAPQSTVPGIASAPPIVLSEPETDVWENFVVVEFDEDSPMLRRKLSAFEDGLEDLRSAVKELIKSGASYRDVCSDELDALKSFQEDLGQPEIRKLSPLMSLFNSTLRNLMEHKEGVLDSLELNVLISLDEFLKKDIKEAQILRRDLQRARDVFETLESKYMHHRRTKSRSVVIGNVGKTHDAVEEQMFTELQAAKSKFELARFSLVQQINHLETKKRFVLMDRIACCLGDYLAYFRRGYQIMASYATTIDEARAELSGTKGKFDEIVERWNEKRMQLEAQLHSGAFPFMSKERRKQHLYSKGSEKVTVHSRASRASHDPSVLHEGYLYKRSSNVRKDWKRRWFVLRTDQLLYYRGWKDPTPQPVCDMLLCTVREVTNPELRSCFEIISPNNRPYLLQAVNEFEMKTWMDAIRKSIELNLVQQQQKPSVSQSSGITDPEVNLLMSLNPTCADCSAQNPEWVSLNLGVMVCISCSGIHRSLGVHISKVRSVALDQLPRSQLQLLRRLGNGTMNSILEARLHRDAAVDQNSTSPSGSNVFKDPDNYFVSKPNPSATGPEREQFIRAKYVDKAFIDRSRNASIDIGKFFDAIAENDIELVMKFVLMGFPLNEMSAHEPSNLPAGSTALHVASALGSTDCLELLLLSGGSHNIKNAAGESPEDVARRLDQQPVLKILNRYSRTSDLPTLATSLRSHSTVSRSAPSSPVNEPESPVNFVDSLDSSFAMADVAAALAMSTSGVSEGRSVASTPSTSTSPLGSPYDEADHRRGVGHRQRSRPPPLSQTGYPASTHSTSRFPFSFTPRSGASPNSPPASPRRLSGD